MTSECLLVVGAGGHAKVVIDAARSAGSQFRLVLADDDERKRGQMVLSLKVIVPVTDALNGVDAFHVAIGNNGARERMSDHLIAKGLVNRAIAHPRACISKAARIAEGVFIAAQGIVGPDARVDRGCIINHGAVVDHDCHLGAFTHIAPNVTLGGGVRVGRRVLIGAGANILPGVSIGDDCVVGAGSVVLSDLEPRGVYVGVPTRKYK
jgi:sugar O-acyltransferase (sialic acid O-acetyltransferase NeuD family)